MYHITDINEDNIELFSDYFDDDLSENVGRFYYRFIVLSDDDSHELVAAMAWMLKFVENEDRANESNIIWVRCDDDNAFGPMMEAYSERIRAEQVVRSTVSIPVKGGKEMKAKLMGAGFNMRLAESDVVLVRLSELSEMPLMKKMRKLTVPDNIVSLNLLTMRCFRKGVSKSISMGRYGLCEDLAELGILWFDDDVSCVSTIDNGINGLFLFHKRPSGIIAVQLFVCLDKSFRTTLPYMMRRFIIAMEEKYGPDTLVELDRHNEQSMLLAEKLLPRGFGIPIYRGSRKEER